ncbi:MAG TPA: high-affinity nickel-transporter protein, partial [Candidatus Eisenbacteria bacterium]|nr:high-affinity nickel-transporter protein [Candidatus Eisenbacteria bacterium]
MTSPAALAAPLLLGLALGLRHALDPDHLAAMGTIVAREPAPARAGWLGAVWGMGHSAALFAASLLIVVLRVPVPPRVANLLELGVAAMLIVLGVHSILAAS